MKKQEINIHHHESNVLGLFLQYPEKIYETKLTKEHFSSGDKKSNQNKALFSIMQLISEERNLKDLEFDANTLTMIAHEDEMVAEVLNNVFDNSKKETIQYLKSLKSFDISDKSLSYYENRLIKAKVANEVLESNSKHTEYIVENFNELDKDEIIDFGEEKLLKINSRYINNGEDEPQMIGEGLVDEYMNREYNPQDFVGLASPWNDIDKFTNGILREGSCTIINARPKTGKSSFMTNIAAHVGFDLGEPVYFVFNEMKRQEVKDRLISYLTGIEVSKIERGYYNKPGNEKMKEKVKNATEQLAKSKIILDRMRQYTATKLLKRARYLNKRYDLAGMIFDYIKAPADFKEGNDSLRHALGDVVTVLKEEVADAENMFVVSATQAKQSNIFKTHESDEPEQYCTCYLCLWQMTRQEAEKKMIPNATHGVTVKYNRYGSKHNKDYKDNFIPLRFNENRLGFKTVIR